MANHQHSCPDDRLPIALTVTLNAVMVRSAYPDQRNATVTRTVLISVMKMDVNLCSQLKRQPSAGWVSSSVHIPDIVSTNFKQCNGNNDCIEGEDEANCHSGYAVQGMEVGVGPDIKSAIVHFNLPTGQNSTIVSLYKSDVTSFL